MTTIAIRLLLPGLLLLGAAAMFGEDSAAPDHLDSHSDFGPAAPEAGHRKEIHLRHVDGGPGEMETVTFLGVETAPVSKAMIAQLALPNQSGLVVEHVVPNTAAANSLQPYDILLKFDDQILIDQHQLSVLVRTHAVGDEITLTYMRAGKTATTRVKLGAHEAPKFGDLFYSAPGTETPDLFRSDTAPRGPAEREHIERMLALVDRAHRGEPVRIDIKRGPAGDDVRAVKIDTANSTVMYSDDHGSLELTVKDGKKSVVAKDAKGVEEFAGPATTEDERKRIPAKILTRLDKLESMRNISFHADGDFQQFETDVARPEGKGVLFIRQRSEENVPLLAM